MLKFMGEEGDEGEVRQDSEGSSGGWRVRKLSVDFSFTWRKKCGTRKRRRRNVRRGAGTRKISRK